MSDFMPGDCAKIAHVDTELQDDMERLARIWRETTEVEFDHPDLRLSVDGWRLRAVLRKFAGLS